MDAFNVRQRFFHIEFFETGPGKMVALEVNMRPPGGFTTDMFNFACDIDIYRLWAQVMMDGSATLDYQRKYHCCYASRKNRYDYQHSHDEVMQKFGRSREIGKCSPVSRWPHASQETGSP